MTVLLWLQLCDCIAVTVLLWLYYCGCNTVIVLKEGNPCED